MTKLYGWDFFKKLNALNPLIGRSFDDSITVLNSGERVVGLVNIAAVARNAAKGNPLAINYPTSGTLVVPSATTIIAGCKSPNAAKLFLDFACGGLNTPASWLRISRCRCARTRRRQRG